MTKEEKEVVERNKELIAKYPWLLPHNRFSDKIADDYDYSYTELDAMPDGWRKAFGEQMCEEIQKELEKFDYVDKYRILQIKEKFGFLHWYDSGAPIGKLSDVDETVVVDEWKNQPKSDYKENYWYYVGMNEEGKYIFEHRKILELCKIPEIISKYEDISEKTCIICGKPATKMSVGWISPWCDDCASNNNYEKYVPIEEYFSKINNDV